METNIDKRLNDLGIILPPAPKPVGVYKPVLVIGNHLYVSGQGPLKADGSLIKGRLGDDLDLEAGRQAARQVGLAMLSTIQTQLGTLNRIKRLIKVLGMVNCTPDFGQHPAVINGF
ncbi:MAG: RidA family protein, partial [Bacteroidales bacterium]|nr:RidA family protein [Bacteroidales bacterium]